MFQAFFACEIRQSLLRKDRAQTDLIEAIACLLDDDVAEKAFEAIYHCERKATSSF